MNSINALLHQTAVHNAAAYMQNCSNERKTAQSIAQVMAQVISEKRAMDLQRPSLEPELAPQPVVEDITSDQIPEEASEEDHNEPTDIDETAHIETYKAISEYDPLS